MQRRGIILARLYLCLRDTEENLPRKLFKFPFFFACLIKEEKMRLNNNALAFIILAFIFISVLGNLFVWFKVNGYLPEPKVTQGSVSLCIDAPPVLASIGNKSGRVGQAFIYQINVTNSL